MKQKGLVFIHGAGLGSFIWTDLIPLIKIPAMALDFPNRNKGSEANLALSFQDYAKVLIQQVEKWDIEKLIIVTHSIGGCLGLKLAEYFKERTVGFVAISAAIPSDGNSFISCLPFPQKIIMPVLMRIAGTKPPQKAIENGLCNGLTSGQTKEIVKNFTPESRLLYTEKCYAGIPDTKRLYIKLLNDKEFPFSMQERMAKNLNANKICTLDSGHLPMLSHPKKLAKLLNEFSEEIS